MSATTLFVISFMAVGCVWAGFAYQRLSNSRDSIDLAFDDIDVYLKHRHEITPRLLEFLAGHQFVDASLTSALLQARHMMANAAVKIRTFSNDTPSINSLANANTAYTQALNKVLATASNCPAIQNDARFKSLVADVEKIENAIASGRQHYNDAVTLYNDQCAAFPALLIATLLGFRCAGILQSATISNTASATKNSVSTGVAALR
jgi:LemA protein